MPGTPVLVRLPDALAALGDLATNLWFSWNPDARALFAALDRVVWDATGRDPVAAIARMPQEALRSAAADPAYAAELARVHGRMRAELEARTWFDDLPDAEPGARPSPTSASSSGWTRACPSTRAAWACWPATT